jgi:hypothetical protein
LKRREVETKNSEEKARNKIIKERKRKTVYYGRLYDKDVAS